MDAAKDKKINDRLAKKSTQRKNKYAKESSKRKNKFNQRIAAKDKRDAYDLFNTARGDLGTARSEIASALARVSQSQGQTSADNIARTQAANAALATELSGIAEGNDAAAMTALGNNGLAAVGNLKSSRTAQLNAMLAGLQGQQSVETLRRIQSDATTLGEGYASLNEGAYKQNLQNHLNTRNEALNNVNRDLGDAYDQSKFDLRETLESNRYSLADQLDQNKADYERQRAAERAAAARSIRGSGYGYGGYGIGTGNRGVSSPAPYVKPSGGKTNAQALAENMDRLRRKKRGGFWSAKDNSIATIWNQTIN